MNPDLQEGLEWSRAAVQMICDYMARVEHAEPEAIAAAKTEADWTAIFERNPPPLMLAYALHRAGMSS